MTKPLPFTQAGIRRAIEGARKAGIEVAGFAVQPDGTIVVFDGDNVPAALPKAADTHQDAEASKWRFRA